MKYLTIVFCAISLSGFAQKIHFKSILVDTHNDAPTACIEKKVSFDQDLTGINHSDLKRFKEGGLDYQLFSIWCDGEKVNPYAWAMREMDTIDAVAARNRDKMVVAKTWKEIQKLALEYPDVTVEYQFVDATAMLLIKDPKRFDVVVTANLFGDILTDEASQIAGSMGMLASASIGDGTGVYEPIHGSAHDITGKGLANPLASILSAALLLDISFSLKKESESIINAVDALLKKGFRTRDIADEHTPANMILSTEAIGEEILKLI